MAEASTLEPSVESHAFKAETKALLGLMINSLYTNREVFLRELISNASDALDKLRLRALTEHGLLAEGEQLQVTLRPDAAAGTLTISDNGVGMTHDELVANLGTIARSGSREFLEKLSGDARKDASLIGQFGVGFYSAFLVAGKVRVVSRAAGSEEAWAWESEADGSFTVAPARRDERGTDITLSLRDDQKDYCEPWRLRELVTRYSDFVGHPIHLVTEAKEAKEGEAEAAKATSDEVINKGKALWTRPKAELTAEQYGEFYKHISHDWEEPLAWSHFQVEGAQMFTGLLYLPKHPPFDMFLGDRQRQGLRLYVRRVFVMEECDALLPDYLRFLRGIVDSDDLPLNVSREILQQERAVETIRRSVTRKALELLEELAKDRPDDYRTFWEAFGGTLKEGLQQEPGNRDRLAKLCRWESSADKGLVSLEDYVARMPEGQDAIYYVTGPDKEFVEKSPHIEALRAKGWEVLWFVDPVDELVADVLREFQGKKLVSASKGELKLDGDAEQASQDAGEFARLVAALKTHLGERVKEVRLTERLTDSPVCLVAGEHELSANMERLMRAWNRPVPRGKRVLELNKNHALIKNLNAMAGEDKHQLRLKEWAEVLFDQALLTEGSTIADPARFSRAMTGLLLDASQRELGA